MHLRSAVVTSILLALSGCATMTPEEVWAADARTCRGYGFRPNTDAFAECLQRIDLDRDADRRARVYGDGFYGRGFGVGIGLGGRL
jgi:hypothetical protein